MSRGLLALALAMHASGCQWILDVASIEPRENTLDCELPDSMQCQQWSPRDFEACNICKPSAALTLEQSGTYLYNTDAGTLSDPLGMAIKHTSQILKSGGDNTEIARLLSIDDLVVSETATLRATGKLPLIIASWSEIEVLGIIDLNSNELDGPGAGANLTVVCDEKPAFAGESGVIAGAGGGGGAFQGNGGMGGNADADLTGGTAYPKGGLNGSSLAKPDVVHGGCPGGPGGNGTMGGTPAGGLGGDGGGAIQLTARTSITISGGVIKAGGGAGRGGSTVTGNDGSGGGGGGSGGFIGFDAPIVVAMNAVLVANGGGGGEGADGDENGNPGMDGTTATTAASGGIGGATSGGNGGPGGSRDVIDGQPAPTHPDGGGGGGGGSAGYLWVYTGQYSPSGTTESPQAIVDSPDGP